MAVPGFLLHRIGCIVALTVCLGAGGCEDKAAPPTVTASIALLPSEHAAYRTVLDRFTRETGIHVSLVAQQYTDIRRALEAEVQAGSGALDIVEMDVFYLRDTRPLVRDLTHDAHAWKPYTTLTDGARAAGVFNGAVQFIPHRLSWQALVYNSDVIPTPPATWDELLTLATKHPGKIGLKGARYEGLTCDILPFIWQAGGDPLDLTHPGTQAAFEFLQQLGPFLNPSSPTYKEGTILEAHEKQEILLHQNWPFVVPALREKNLLPDPHRVAPLPRGPAGAATVLGGGYLAVSAVSAHPAAAWRLVEYLASPGTQRQLAAGLGWIPVQDRAWEALDDTTADHLAGYRAMADSVRARPAVPHYEKISRLWQTAFHAIVYERADVDATLAALNPQLQALRAGR